MLIALVPVPFVDLRFGNAKASCQRLNFLLAPVRVPVKLGLQNFALKAVHARHEALTVGLELVARRLEHFVEAIGLEQAQSAQAVLVGSVEGRPVRRRCVD